MRETLPIITKDQLATHYCSEKKKKKNNKLLLSKKKGKNIGLGVYLLFQKKKKKFLPVEMVNYNFWNNNNNNNPGRRELLFSFGATG